MNFGVADTNIVSSHGEPYVSGALGVVDNVVQQENNNLTELHQEEAASYTSLAARLSSMAQKNLLWMAQQSCGRSFGVLSKSYQKSSRRRCRGLKSEYLRNNKKGMKKTAFAAHFAHIPMLMIDKPMKLIPFESPLYEYSRCPRNHM